MSIDSRRARFAALLAIAGLAAGTSAQQSAAARGAVKVFVLAGQSNMEGKARVALADRQAADPATAPFYEPFRRDGAWRVRDDVFVDFLGRRGGLTVGFGSPDCIGPELGFGSVVGDRLDEPVLLIKTAWGGKSLGCDFLPPGAAQPDDARIAAIVARENAENEKRGRPAVTADAVRARYGCCYRDMIAEVRACLADVSTRFSTLAGRDCEVAGFVWFQSWNDQYDETFLAGYADNLAALIRSVRADLGRPDLPVVIGQMGQNGLEPAKGPMLRIKDAQKAVAERPEFAATVRTVVTDVYWDKDAAALIDGWEKHVEEWNKVGSDRAYHYLGSARTFIDVGRAFGRAMLELMDHTASTPR